MNHFRGVRNMVLMGFVVVLLSQVADACRRCGLRQCRFAVRRVVKQPVFVQQFREYIPPQSVTITNNYAQPLVSPLAVQGKTVYGYSAASLALQVNPSDLLNQAARLTENAQKLAQEGLQGYQLTSQLTLQNQTQLAKIMAAIDHLKLAIGESQPVVTQQKIEIKNGVAKNVQKDRPVAPRAPEPIGGASVPKVFQDVCLKCHSGAAPKGQFSLDAEKFDSKTITRSLRAIGTGKMPPADSGLKLEGKDKGEIMTFLLSNEG